MTNILVTGAAGFIGSWLTQRLLAQGNFVVAVDDFSTSPFKGWGEFMNEISPNAVIHSSKFRPYSATVAEFHHLYCSANRAYHFDTIYHLASPVGPAGVLQHRGRMIRQIVDDTYRVLDLAGWNPKARSKLVYVSTSEVYGGGVNGACKEDMDRVIQAKPTARLEYAVGKLAGELAVLNQDEVPACVVRPFNVAGPRQSDKGGFVLPRFIKQAMRNEPITVFGSGNQMRAFTDVADIVQGLLQVAGLGKPGQVYNLGNEDNRITINRLAEIVKDVTGSSSVITHVDGKSIYGPLYEEANDKWPVGIRHAELQWTAETNVVGVVIQAYEYTRARENVLP